MSASAKRLPLQKANPDPEQLFAATAQDAEQMFGRFRTMVRSIVSVAEVARALWPQKPAAALAIRTGASLRAAEYWIAGEREMSAEAFVALLRSDEGFAFLEAVMTAVPAPSRPAWWRRLSRNASRSEIRRRQVALAAEIDALEREEQLDLELRLKGPGR